VFAIKLQKLLKLVHRRSQ